MLFNIFGSSEPLPLPVSTDIHCHVVPGVDDGSPDAVTSVQLLKAMRGWGLKRIFASPHVTADTFENTPETLKQPWEELLTAVEEAKLDVELHRHAEYRMDDFFMQQIDANNLTPLPQGYILVENSWSFEPWNLQSLFFDLQLKGYTPILAHPERYPYYSHSHKERYHELHQSGLLFQINLLSLAGHYGKHEQKTARYLLENELVDFVGTDLHRLRHVESMNRYLSSNRYKKDLKLMAQNPLRNDSL